MPIRLLALDLDGTLLNSRGEVSAGNRLAIEHARNAGVNVAIATGRRFRDAQPLALELGLDVPVISHNGALTKHAHTLEIVRAMLIKSEAARAVVEAGRAAGADPMISTDPVGEGLLVYDHISDGNMALSKYVAWSTRIVGSSAGESVRRVESLAAFLDHDPIHISFSGTCASMAQVASMLRSKLEGLIRVLCTIYPEQDFTLIDVLNPDASKGAGVEGVANELGLSGDEVMSIGDNENDLEMLRFAGTPVVMRNAAPELRASFGFHETVSNDEDGVARAIERFILEPAGATY